MARMAVEGHIGFLTVRNIELETQVNLLTAEVERLRSQLADA